MIFVGIIGNRNSGKSTIIKSLSGCGNSSFRDYMDGFSNQSVYICCASPQEKRFVSGRKFDLAAIEETMQSAHKKVGCRGMVVAMQATGKSRLRPDYMSIFRAAKNNGFTELYAFIVDPGYNDSASIKLENTKELSELCVEVKRLSGKHFPHSNATYINNISRIIF
ncbi:hypothetical protein [Cellvibrio mixtus]|uniref:hypothetical protein n=1 Tax=Cellvibrio mixtus TaxID=39650 RepID=UPI0005874FC5|nr:hypothetical protein [Cellvibrio mixtus]